MGSCKKQKRGTAVDRLKHCDDRLKKGFFLFRGCQILRGTEDFGDMEKTGASSCGSGPFRSGGGREPSLSWIDRRRWLFLSLRTVVLHSSEVDDFAEIVI